MSGVRSRKAEAANGESSGMTTRSKSRSRSRGRVAPASATAVCQVNKIYQHKGEIIKNTDKGHNQHVSWARLAGVWACMIVVPLFVYWSWICVEYHQGLMYLPKELTQEAVKAWALDIWTHIATEAVPSAYAWKLYAIWIALQAALFYWAPGPEGFGVVLEDGKTKLKYKYNGQFAFFTTIALVIALQYTGVFSLTKLYDLYPQMLTVCNVWTVGVILFLQIHAAIFGLLERRTDSVVYDFFMGPRLNPRFFGFDVKFFFELRPGIMHWFFTSLGMMMKMYERDGTVTTPMLLVCFYHLCFVNACYKGEQCVPFSMDIIYEKFGWMLLMLDIVMVPFIFPLQAYYLYKIQPFEHHPAITFLLFFTHCFAYFMFDTANAQKDYFREQDHPENNIPKGFPNLPWSKLDNPPYLQTKRGTKLLLGGWWGWARHMNYTGDIIMSWTWGLTCGVGSYFPFAYTTYLTPLLLHREYRDDRECARKYGADWDEYKKKVPYRLIPYVY